jgi:hypothetical protein
VCTTLCGVYHSGDNEIMIHTFIHLFSLFKAWIPFSLHRSSFSHLHVPSVELKLSNNGIRHSQRLSDCSMIDHGPGVFDSLISQREIEHIELFGKQI